MAIEPNISQSVYPDPMVNSLIDQVRFLNQSMSDLSDRQASLEEASAVLRAESLFQCQLPNWKNYSGYLEDTDGIRVRVVDKVGPNNQIEKVIIGYYEVSYKIHRRWAFCPFPSGNVPIIDGGSLEEHYPVVWRRHHMTGKIFPLTGDRFWGKNSGVNGEYCTSTDKNGKEYILIPVNGHVGFPGYVPARNLTASLKNKYLTVPGDFRIVYDNNIKWHLACKDIDYKKHGFTLEGRVWWPVGNPPIRNYDVASRVRKLDEKVQDFISLGEASVLPNQV